VANPPHFEQYPELRAHFDRVFDLVAARLGSPQQQRARGVRAVLDVGAGNGASLAAVVFGTEVRGVAADVHIAPEWLGPPGFAVARADAHSLPFASSTFATSIALETLEWLADPPVALREIARVTEGALIVVQTDWHSLWFDSDDPETSQEFTRLFAGPRTHSPIDRLAEFLESSGLSPSTHDIHPVRGKSTDPDSYAHYLLSQLREWLVIQRGIVRARRFDAWRTALDVRAEEGAFAFSLDRHVVAVDCTST
jgi:SAM-dependent methyltransferase